MTLPLEPTRIDLAGWSREATFGDHKEFQAVFEQADGLGYDGVWFHEFHFQNPPHAYPSVQILAAALFARTERIRIGSQIIALPIHQPMLLAEELAQLDFQSGGRFDLGIGRGTTLDTFAVLGIDPAETRERFARAYATHLERWAGNGPAPATTVQKPHIPIYVAAQSRETLAFAVEHDLPLLLSLEPHEEKQLALYHEVLAEMGGPSAVGRSSLAHYVCIGATRAQAEERVDALIDQIHARRRELFLSRGQDPALAQPPDKRKILAEQFVLGDPDDCIATIHGYREDPGVGGLRCVFNGAGVLGNDEALASMRLFAETVLPNVRDA